MQKVLIIGTTGYLDKYLVQECKRQGYSLLLMILKSLLSRRKYVALQFLCTAMQTDTEAPKYGTHTLENFFKELNASQKS